MVQLAAAIGLDEEAVKKLLKSNEYAGAVERDIYEARQIGVRGVPYFIMNDRYSVSGAQATETFLGALNKTWREWEKERPVIQYPGSDAEFVCDTDGECQ